MEDQLVPVRRSRPLRAAPLDHVSPSEPSRPSALGWTVPPASAIAAAFLPIDGHESGHDSFWSESVEAGERWRNLLRLRRSA
jgi:hypothetical protein